MLLFVAFLFLYPTDPWWNPAAELQAVQRAHRLGQTRRVDVVKFVVTNTIEERIRTLQVGIDRRCVYFRRPVMSGEDWCEYILNSVHIISILLSRSCGRNM